MTARLLDEKPAANDDLTTRLSRHVVSAALVRKDARDPVDFSVWWRVTDALRASVLDTPEAALGEVDAAIGALLHLLGREEPFDTSGFWLPPDDGRALRTAQVLVARLLFDTVPTPPTLVLVRLARLRRALAAGMMAARG